MELLAAYGSNSGSGGDGYGPLFWIVAAIVAIVVIWLATWLLRRGRARSSISGGAMSTGPTSSTTGTAMHQSGTPTRPAGTDDERHEYPQAGTG